MAAQECLWKTCKQPVDRAKHADGFCRFHKGNVADSGGAAKSAALSGVAPIRVVKEKVVPVNEDGEALEEAPLEGLILDQDPASAEAAAEQLKYLEGLATEMIALDGVVKLYAKSKARQDEIKEELRTILEPSTYNMGGGEFEVKTSRVFDAKLAAAATATEDKDGNKIKPLLSKAELARISVSTPNAAKAKAEFKDRPELLEALQEERRSLIIKTVDAK